MSPKVMYPQQQMYHITFGMNVINWHASTDTDCYKITCEPVKTQISQSSLIYFMAMSYLIPLEEMYKITGQRDF